jgi:hypothetical protein
MALRVAGRDAAPDRPIWLRPGEVVDAELRLAADQGPALNATRTVEAYIGNRLIDGIQVLIQRPASVLWHPQRAGAPEPAHAARGRALVGAR